MVQLATLTLRTMSPRKILDEKQDSEPILALSACF